MIHLRRATDGGFYINIVAKNGREVWRTSETYKRRAGAINALNVLYGMIVAFEGIGKTDAKYPFIDHTR